MKRLMGAATLALAMAAAAVAAHYDGWTYLISTPGPVYSVTMVKGSGEGRQIKTLLITAEQYEEIRSCTWHCEIDAWDGNDDGDTQDIGEFLFGSYHKNHQ